LRSKHSPGGAGVGHVQDTASSRAPYQSSSTTTLVSTSCFGYYLRQGWGYASRSVCLSAILSVYVQDYCKSQAISLKLGVNWAYQSELINFWRWSVPDTHSGSLFYFPHHWGIGDFRFISISHNTVTGRFSRHSAKWLTPTSTHHFRAIRQTSNLTFGWGLTMGTRQEGQGAVPSNNLVGAQCIPPIFGTWISYFSPKLNDKKIVFSLYLHREVYYIAFWDCCDCYDWVRYIYSMSSDTDHTIPQTVAIYTNRSQPCTTRLGIYIGAHQTAYWWLVSGLRWASLRRGTKWVIWYRSWPECRAAIRFSSAGTLRER